MRSSARRSPRTVAWACCTSGFQPPPKVARSAGLGRWRPPRPKSGPAFSPVGARARPGEAEARGAGPRARSGQDPRTPRRRSARRARPARSTWPDLTNISPKVTLRARAAGGGGEAGPGRGRSRLTSTGAKVPAAARRAAPAGAARSAARAAGISGARRAGPPPAAAWDLREPEGGQLPPRPAPSPFPFPGPCAPVRRCATSLLGPLVMVYMARRFHTTAGPRPDPAPAPGLALNGRRALRGGGGPVTRPRPLKGPHGLGPTPGHAAEAALGPFGKLAGGGGAGSNPAPAPGGARPRRTKRPAARERPCCLEAR